MATLSSFLPHIRPDVEGAPTPLILERTRRVVRDFCQRAHVVRQDHAAINVVAATALYTLTEPSDLQIVTLHHVLHDSQTVVGVGEDWLDTSFPHVTPRYVEHRAQIQVQWRTQVSQQPAWYYQPSRIQVRLVPIPEAALTDGLEVSMILKPTPVTSEVPDVVYDEHFESITAGVLAELLEMTGKAWHEPRRAETERAMFEAAIDQIRGEQIRSRTRNTETGGRTTVYE